MDIYIKNEREEEQQERRDCGSRLAQLSCRTRSLPPSCAHSSSSSPVRRNNVESSERPQQSHGCGEGKGATLVALVEFFQAGLCHFGLSSLAGIFKRCKMRSRDFLKVPPSKFRRVVD